MLPQIIQLVERLSVASGRRSQLIAGNRERSRGSRHPLTAEPLEPRLLLAIVAAGDGAPVAETELAADLTTASATAALVTPTSSEVTWGAGLTDPGAASAWDLTGMPLGEFHSRLNFVKRATVDPLLAPGNPNFWHAHDFFVNPTIDENTTLASLMAAGESAAAPANNLSVYWVPSLFNEASGEYVDPLDSSIAYYSVQKPLEPSKIVAMPAGLSIIAGNAMPTARQPTAVVFWNYIGTSTQYDHIPQGDEWQDLPLQAVVMFPQFWNGASLAGSNFKDHMAYDRGGDGGPSSHPYLLPELQLQIHYGRIPRDASLVLSSDAMTADRPGYAPGWSMHADFIHTPWPERDAAGNLYDGFERRVNDALRWPTVAGTDGNAARTNPRGLDQPFTPVPIDLAPVLPATGETVSPPAEPPAEPPTAPPTMGPQPREPHQAAPPLARRPLQPPQPPPVAPTGPDLRLAWPTPDVVMISGVEVGIHGTVSDPDGLASIELTLEHESGSYLQPDGSLGERASLDGRVVAADGHWRLLVTPPAPGNYTLSVAVTDATGGVSQAETSFSVIGETLIAPPATDPTSTDPTSTDPASSDPTSSDPTPTDPAPTDPAPTDPAPTDPTPTDPTPTDPTPTDPAPTDPTPTDPTPAPDPGSPPIAGNQPLPAVSVETALAEAVAAGNLLPAPLAGAAVPTSFDGTQLSPLVTDAFDQAVPSSDWWSSVVMPVFGNGFSAPLHAHPLTVQLTANGLLFGAPTKTTVAVTGSTTAEYKTPHRFDLRLDLLGDAAASFAVEDYGDWSFTGRWQGGGVSPTATLAQGSPVIWLDEVDFSRAAIQPQAAGAVIEMAANHAFITIAGRTSLVLAPAGTRLEQAAGGLVVRGGTSGRLAVALLPEDSAQVRGMFLELAGLRPAETSFSWDTVSDPYKIKLRYDVAAADPDAADTLVAVYPHIARLAAAGGQLGTPVSTAGYRSPRGEMPLYASSSLDLQLPKRGVLPTLPSSSAPTRRPPIRWRRSTPSATPIGRARRCSSWLSWPSSPTSPSSR